jgi:hypothetical protein
MMSRNLLSVLLLAIACAAVPSSFDAVKVTAGVISSISDEYIPGKAVIASAEGQRRLNPVLSSDSAPTAAPTTQNYPVVRLAVSYFITNIEAEPCSDEVLHIIANSVLVTTFPAPSLVTVADSTCNSCDDRRRSLVTAECLSGNCGGGDNHKGEGSQGGNAHGSHGSSHSAGGSHDTGSAHSPGSINLPGSTGSIGIGSQDSSHSAGGSHDTGSAHSPGSINLPGSTGSIGIGSQGSSHSAGGSHDTGSAHSPGSINLPGSTGSIGIGSQGSSHGAGGSHDTVSAHSPGSINLPGSTGSIGIGSQGSSHSAGGSHDAGSALSPGSSNHPGSTGSTGIGSHASSSTGSQGSSHDSEPVISVFNPTASPTMEPSASPVHTGCDQGCGGSLSTASPTMGATECPPTEVAPASHNYTVTCYCDYYILDASTNVLSLVEQATAAIINAVQSGQLTDEIQNEADEAGEPACSSTQAVTAEVDCLTCDVTESAGGVLNALTTGQIAGICVGAVVFTSVIFAFVAFYYNPGLLAGRTASYTSGDSPVEVENPAASAV